MKSSGQPLYTIDDQNKIIAMRTPINSRIDEFIYEYIESNCSVSSNILNYWSSEKHVAFLEESFCVCAHDLDAALTEKHQKNCLASVYDLVVNFHTIGFVPSRGNLLELALYEMIDSVSTLGTLIIGIDSNVGFRRNRFLREAINNNFVNVMDYSKKGWGLLLIANQRRSIL